MAEVHQAMEERHHYGFDPPDPIRGRLDFLEYLKNVNLDYKKYHMDGVKHDELCSWCNYHACIYDVILEIYDYDDCKANCKEMMCEICLSTTTWYKKL